MERKIHGSTFGFAILLVQVLKSSLVCAFSVVFEFQHNVCGRSIYAEGTVDATLFLAKKVINHLLKSSYILTSVFWYQPALFERRLLPHSYVFEKISRWLTTHYCWQMMNFLLVSDLINICRWSQKLKSGYTIWLMFSTKVVWDERFFWHFLARTLYNWWQSSGSFL